MINSWQQVISFILIRFMLNWFRILTPLFLSTRSHHQRAVNYSP